MNSDSISTAIEMCHAHGLQVTAPNYKPPETPKQFCARIGIHQGSFGRTMSRIPEGIPCVMKVGRKLAGRRARTISIRSTQQLEKWILQRKKQAGKNK